MSEPPTDLPPSRPRSSHRSTKITPLGKIIIAGIAVLLAVVGIQLLFGGGDDTKNAQPTQTIPGQGEPSETEPDPDATGTGEPTSPATPGPLWVGPGPINQEFPGLTTLRGNWTRNFFGIGPVPHHPKVKWRAGPWCGSSTDLGETTNWCGTGWNGQPSVIPQPDGSTEVRIGGYDWAYHFLDGETGKDVHPPYKTGDLAKGSASSDPDGCPILYGGSRDNEFRIIALDKRKPRVVWSMNAETSVPDPRWNDDWDGAAQIVGDYMLVGGENSWFYIVKLNKQCDNGKIQRIDPKIVFQTPGWDAELLQDLQGNQDASDISIENSVAYDPERKVAYFGNGGGLIQGYDISGILNGGGSAKRVFRYWMAGENDASIVIAEDGDLIASSHWLPPNQQASKSGQLVRLDPTKAGNPLVWKLKEGNMSGGEAGFFSTPALVGDMLYATATAGTFMGIDANTGKVLWEKSMVPPLWSGPAVVDGVAVLGDCSGSLYGFDVTNPTKEPPELWRLKLGGCIESTPAIWNGWIYVGTRSGYFYGIADKHPDTNARKYPAGSNQPTS